MTWRGEDEDEDMEAENEADEEEEEEDKDDEEPNRARSLLVPPWLKSWVATIFMGME